MKRTALSAFVVLALLVTGITDLASAEQVAGSPPAVTAPGPNPLAVGKSAIEHGEYDSAKTFFTQYLIASPNDLEARFYLGGSYLGLKDFPAAVKQFQTIIAAKPDAWPAHMNLALAYAQMQDWPNFDKEQALLKVARDRNAPTLDKINGDLIDVLQVGPKTYRVLYFYTLTGRYHTRYAFVHSSSEGKLTDYIQCESDDVDQFSFKQKHPKEAAGGDRSFSLDTYDIGEHGLTQGLVKFYWDGEPTYETVRADALKVLQAQGAPTPAPK
ncbi:MAG: tetratricopeptide repeat protein [Acidobacteriaceae bacterium]